MKSTNTSYTEEQALGDNVDHLIPEMRLLAINNFFYISSSFLLAWMVWQFSICWTAYSFGIFNQWWVNDIKFYLVSAKWSQYRVTVTFLLTPIIYLILGLFSFRLTGKKYMRKYRPFLTWFFLMMMTMSCGQFFIGFLFRRFVTYVTAMYAVPIILYPLFALPFGIIMALLGRPLETLIIRLASRQRMINTENKQQYLFTTALIPMASFLVLLAVMMVPHSNWIMFGIGLTAAFPVAVASFYGGKRFNFRSVKPHKPTLAMFPIILFAVLLILARYLNMFGFKGFMGTVLD